MPILKACKSRRTLNGTTKPSRSPVVNHLVFDVYPMLPHGSESWVWLEDGAAAFLPGHTFRYALRLRLQEVAKRAVLISTDHLSGYGNIKGPIEHPHADVVSRAARVSALMFLVMEPNSLFSSIASRLTCSRLRVI